MPESGPSGNCGAFDAKVILNWTTSHPHMCRDDGLYGDDNNEDQINKYSKIVILMLISSMDAKMIQFTGISMNTFAPNLFVFVTSCLHTD